MCLLRMFFLPCFYKAVCKPAVYLADVCTLMFVKIKLNEILGSNPVADALQAVGRPLGQKIRSCSK